MAEHPCCTSFPGAVLATSVTQGQGFKAERPWGERAVLGPACPGRALTFFLCSALRNETVLHQFCCPAADAEQKPSCADPASQRWEVIGGWSSPPHPTVHPLGAKHTPLHHLASSLSLVLLLVCFYLLPHTSISLCFLWTPDEPLPTFEVIMPFPILLLSK